MSISPYSLLGWRRALLAGVLVTASVLAHEFGHAVVARRFGVRVKLVGLSIKGGYIVREQSPHRGVEALITLAGPAVNFMLVALLVLAVAVLREQSTLLWVALSNLILALANLLPIGPSDGKRLWKLVTATPTAAPTPAPLHVARSDKAA